MNINEDVIKNVINIDNKSNNDSKMNVLSSKNIFDGHWTLGSIDPQTGNILSGNAAYSATTTNLIKVKPNTTYYFNCVSGETVDRVATYDINGVYLARSGSLSSHYITTGSNVYYIRFNIWNSNGISLSALGNTQLTESSVETTYEDYISPSILVNNLEFLSKNNTIIESGSNSQGKWIKFGDGTMICYGKAVYESISITGGFEGIYYVNVSANFPNVFAYRPILITQICDSASSFSLYNNGAQVDSFSGFIWKVQSKSNTNIRLDWVAIGRWK